MDELERPVFDEVIHTNPPWDDSDCIIPTVIHRNAQGQVYAWHSPLESGPIHCTFCETPGNRVWVS